MDEPPWPAPYFALDEQASLQPSLLKLRASFKGVALTGNAPGLDWKYGTLLVGEEDGRLWYRRADRTQIYQLVTFWHGRAPELHASMFRFNPRIDLFLEPYSRTKPEFTLYFTDQASAQACHAILCKFTRVLPVVGIKAEASSVVTTTTSAATPSTIRGGVGFIEHKQREQLQQESRLASQAFSGDLAELQSRAQAVLHLVQRYAQEASSSNTTGDRDAFDALLAGIGLVNNPVTKQNSGKRYHEKLAGQIEAFVLERQCIVISLPDVFALYNRARAGSALVSPQDLQHACELLLSSNSNRQVEYWEYAHSGVKCLRNIKLYAGIADEFNEAEQSTTTGVDCSQLCKRVAGLSLILAKEWFLEREAMGDVVRDVDTYGNVAWFTNVHFK